jgi:hypothetical protein
VARRVQPPAGEVEPDGDRGGLGEHLLPVNRELAREWLRHRVDCYSSI